VKVLLDAGADTTLINHASKIPEDFAKIEAIKIQFREHRVAIENEIHSLLPHRGIAGINRCE
jgi:hypothetical protein